MPERSLCIVGPSRTAVGPMAFSADAGSPDDCLRGRIFDLLL
jgi:hypothetical protein